MNGLEAGYIISIHLERHLNDAKIISESCFDVLRFNRSEALRWMNAVKCVHKVKTILEELVSGILRHIRKDCSIKVHQKTWVVV